MAGVPRHDIPLTLRRYDPAHPSKKRTRYYVGRTNRLEDEAQLLHDIEKVFVRTSSAQLTVAEKQARCGYRSNNAANRATATRRDLTMTLTGRSTDELHEQQAGRRSDGDAIYPPPSPPRSPALGSIAYQKKLADMAAHPTVATLLRENEHGKGRKVEPENFFLRGATCDGAYTAPPLQDGERQLLRSEARYPFLLSNRVPVVAAAGGQLEYNDPVRDEYSRNPTVARFDVHQMRKYQEVTGATSADELHLPWEEHEDVVVTGGEGSEASVGEGSSSSFSSAQQQQQQQQQQQVTQKQVRRDKDYWVDSYVRSVDPYKVEPFKGRCGYSDFRLTYHRVQADATSAMWSPPETVYRSVAHAQLDCPNEFQINHGGRRRFDREKTQSYSSI